MDERDVPIGRRRGAKGLEQLMLTKRIGQMIVAANNVRDRHVDVVHHHGQHVGRRAVGAQQDHVVELRVGDAHIALHEIRQHGLPLLGGLEPNDGLHAGGGVLGIAVAPTAVIADGLTRGFLRLAHGGEFFRRRIAAISFALGEQLLRHFAVPVGAGELEYGLTVVIEAQPCEPGEDGVYGVLRRAGPVGILDAQQERPAGVLGIEPIEKCRPCPADMQVAGGRGGKTGDDFGHGQRANKGQNGALFSTKRTTSRNPCPSSCRTCLSRSWLVPG